MATANLTGPARMRVTFDDQLFTFQRQGGAARYFTELITAFRSEPDLGIEPVLDFDYVVNEYLMQVDPAVRLPRLPSIAQRPQVLRVLNRAKQGLRLKPADLLHHTHYSASGLRTPAKLRVCTVYDMIPEVFPELFVDWKVNPHAAKSQYVAACDAVLCISNATKTDAIAHYGALDKPVVVTPLGVDERFFAATPSTSIAEPYVLYVGFRDWYKNFDVALRALARFAPAVPLLMCVGPPFSAAELERIAELGLDGRVQQRNVADGELPGLYAAAAALVFPSKYEGFGLPTVEAFAAGCPVILADMPCAVEIGGDAAQFFTPDDDETLATLIDGLVHDSAQRERWVTAGRERAREFTWRRTAELTAAVYRSLGVSGSR